MELFFEIISNILNHNNSIYFWVIIALIVLFISEFKLNYDYIKQKILFSYFVFILLRFLGLISIKFILFFSLVFYFIFIEFIFSEGRKKLVIKNPIYYLLDFFYVMIFKYHIIGFLLSLFLISNKFYGYIVSYFNEVNSIHIYYGLGFLSIIVYLFTVSRVFINKFNTFTFDEIINKMESILSFKNYEHDYRLEDFSKILLRYEDKSFFKRKNNFTLLNYSFIKYKFYCVYNNRVNKLYKVKFIGIILKTLVTILIIIFKLFRNIVFKLINIFNILIKIITKKRKLYSIRTIIRGYSTIEMQLLRTLALKDGYECTIQRKFYELIYTDMFFKSLKNAYRYYLFDNLDQYKYYLLELYIRVAPIFINGNRYNNINLLFKDRDNIFELTNEEFFLFTLGLSNKEISFEKIDDYYCPIVLDRLRYVKAMEEVLNIYRHHEPDESGSPIKIMLFDNIICKRYPVYLYFDNNKKLIDIIKYINEYYCDKGMESYITNIESFLFSNLLDTNSINYLDIPIFNKSGKFTDIFNITIKDLLSLDAFSDNYLEITYNCSIGIGGVVGIFDGIKYYFHNNEKNIHSSLPHVHCKYGEEEIRINLLNFDVLDNKEFKSPSKTRKARKYVIDNQVELLDIWENVIDKDNVLNKKIGEYLYLK